MPSLAHCVGEKSAVMWLFLLRSSERLKKRVVGGSKLAPIAQNGIQVVDVQLGRHTQHVGRQRADEVEVDNARNVPVGIDEYVASVKIGELKDKRP